MARFSQPTCLDLTGIGASVIGALFFADGQDKNRPNACEKRLDYRHLAATVIGIPGIALYVVALNLGLTSRIVPSSLGDYWWTPVVLVLAALRSGLQEEIIAVAFLAKKLKIIRPEITVISVVVISSLFRASYHLYQGFSAFLGNFVMGLVFGYLFMRTGRVAPLVIAHTIMNTAVFIGFPLVAGFL